MGFSKENLTNTNLCLYHFVATFLFPDKHVNEKKQGAKDMIDETIFYMRSRLDRLLTLHEIAQNCNLSASHFLPVSEKQPACRHLIILFTLNYKKPACCCIARI